MLREKTTHILMNEFICNICRVSFSIELKAKRNKRCKECHAKIESFRNKLYRAENFEKIKDSEKEYREKNRDKIKERTTEYRDKNNIINKEKRMNALTPEEDLNINTQWDSAGYKNSSYDPSYTLTPKRKRNIMRLDHKFEE